MSSRTLLPSYNFREILKIEEIAAYLHYAYSADLETDLPGLVSEIVRWALKWNDQEIKLQPKTPLSSLKECAIGVFSGM